MNIVKSLRKLKLFFMQKIKSLKEFISTYLAEILMLFGCFFVCIATYKITVIAFYYVLGAMLIGGSLFVAKTR